MWPTLPYCSFFFEGQLKPNVCSFESHEVVIPQICHPELFQYNLYIMVFICFFIYVQFSF